jgi:hypothetical protein
LKDDAQKLKEAVEKLEKKAFLTKFTRLIILER